MENILRRKSIASKALPHVADLLEKRFIQWVFLIGSTVALLLGIELLDALGLAETFMDQAEVAVQLVLVVLLSVGTPLLMREIKLRKEIALETQKIRSQLELLLEMKGLLQGAEGSSDAYAVLRSAACSLMPDFGGALYILNNSRDKLELATSWEWSGTAPLPQFISPSDCWALKGGKVHFNLSGTHALCCRHHQPDLTVMEIPMITQGKVFGLLLIERSGDAAQVDLHMIADVANALAEAMSLSLSNFQLRERLRSQALRDALTGLYNRRYMDDALKRCIDEASRTQSPLSVLMIDLDKFKNLNDEHGHAMGDTVLADTASTILAHIRPCDIACRYGGEEFIVILPDCPFEDATSRAELLRAQIQRLSDRHDFPISASVGVSATSESSDPDNVLVDADRALYLAKQQGRNRVVAAAQLPGNFEAAETAKVTRG